jgi:outer membrane protein assembly factor BamB
MSDAPLIAPLREVWSIPLKGSRLLRTNDGLLVTEGPHEQIVALSVRSGKKLWSYPWRGSVVPGPDGVVHVALEDGEVHVVDTVTGRPRRVLWCGRPCGFVGKTMIANPSTDCVYGVDWETGQRLWRASVPARVAGVVSSGHTVVAGLYTGIVVALDVRDGREQWRRAWPEWFSPTNSLQNAADVVIAGDDVLVSVPGRTLRLSLATGATVWQTDRQFQVIHGERLYGCEGAEYFALEAATGREVLRRTLDDVPERQGESFQCRVVSETHAFVTTNRSALLALERESGLVAWSHQDPGESQVHACVADGGRLYYRIATKLYAFESSRPAGSRG